MNDRHLMIESSSFVYVTQPLIYRADAWQLGFMSSTQLLQSLFNLI